MTETPSTGAPAADRVDRLDTPSSVPGSSIQEPAEVVAAATISSGPDRSSVTDLRSHAIILAAQISDRVASDRLALHGDKALQAFDSLTDLVAAENTDIQDMLRETREELVDAYIASMMSRAKVACIMLRGVMEGLFTALFYRQQTISLNLWASNKQFVLVHQMFEPNHDFRTYYGMLFKDQNFVVRYPGLTPTKIFEEGIDLYDYLSSHVHKKSSFARSSLTENFEESVVRVFRIFNLFLDVEEDLPALAFPSPVNFGDQFIVLQAAQKNLQQAQKKGRSRP